MIATITSTQRIMYPRSFFRRRSAVHRDIGQLLSEIRRRSTLGLHLGAAGTRIPGLVNCDLFDPGADRKIDATDLSSFGDGSVDLIEHHHMMEHLSFVQADRALAEWARVLKPGGFLVVTCPDLLRVCWLYVKNRGLDLIRPRDGAIEYTIKMLVGSQEHEGMFHKTHYDARRMRRLLPGYGFSVDFCYPYPNRPTPSLLTIARREIAK